VGSPACKTGSTTGTTCGAVLAYNVTVNYAEGTVFGLTRTDICTQPGGSGGARRRGWPPHAGTHSTEVVSSSRISGTGSTPIPGPEGTARWPSSSTNGAVRSWR
jgi:hypothetical protein